MQIASTILTNNQRNEVVEEVHDDKKMVMGQCKTTKNIGLDSLNEKAMSYPWTINTIEVQKNEVKTIRLKLLNRMKPSFLAIGMLKSQSMVFMSPRKGKPCVKMKNIGSCGATYLLLFYHCSYTHQISTHYYILPSQK